MLPTKFQFIWQSGFITIAHFVSIRLQTWSPQAILVSDWLISKKIADPSVNMTTTGHSCF
jgi:hypothetical protein